MADYDKALRFIFGIEYGNNPKNALHQNEGDRGGMTYKGIARRKNVNWAGWVIIDSAIERVKSRNPKADWDAVLELAGVELEKDTKLQALVKELFKPDYWNPIKGDHLTYQATAHEIFQYAVVAGTGTAIRAAQTAAGVKADGIIGPQSLKAINAMNPASFSAAFTRLEKDRIAVIVRNDPTQAKWKRGWENRANIINGGNAAKIV
ncbi:glycosyl hydrolase 108 family protein [Seleniivibrio woodruffii]|uniref:glycosyl hydrolase 108 family protein n=1 Tax=Seleniivibrio woodruffii TaxID=1078050 RepID=UPI00240A8D3D|nr:glycosyl hydrolase 108 family protein [Seleniivibrio woodruffii]